MDSIGFYFETSKNNGIKNPSYEWEDKGEYATKRIGIGEVVLVVMLLKLKE